MYFGDTNLWTELAHTLKARFYMHTAEQRAGAYAQALAEAKLGISSDGGNFFGAFTSNAAEQNFYFQFEITAGRTGYLIADQQFVSLLQTRGDPRRADYFNAAGRGSARPSGADFQQPFITYDENTLIWAEAAYRTGVR